MSATADELFGRDVLFQDGDVVVGADGDLVGVSGWDLLRQDLATLLVSSPGSLLSNSTAGVGLNRWVADSNTAVNRLALENQIADRLTDDPRVFDCVATVILWVVGMITCKITVLSIIEPTPLNLLLTITASVVSVAEA